MSSFLMDRIATRPPGHTTRLTRPGHATRLTRPGHTTRLTRPGHTTRLSQNRNHEIPQTPKNPNDDIYTRSTQTKSRRTRRRFKAFAVPPRPVSWSFYAMITLGVVAILAVASILPSPEKSHDRRRLPVLCQEYKYQDLLDEGYRFVGIYEKRNEWGDNDVIVLMTQDGEFLGCWPPEHVTTKFRDETTESEPGEDWLKKAFKKGDTLTPKRLTNPFPSIKEKPHTRCLWFSKRKWVGIGTDFSIRKKGWYKTPPTPYDVQKLVEHLKGKGDQLPPGWTAHVSNRYGAIFYFHKKTGVRTWENPYLLASRQ